MSNVKPHLVFIHIPKTAGTFVRNGLIAHYQRVGCVYPSEPYLPFAKMNTDDLTELAKRDVLCGHEPIQAFEKNLARPAQYFTFLRNPVDRLLSYYNHAMSHFSQFKDRKVTPTKFIQSKANYELDNLQLRYLSGNPLKSPVGQPELDYAKRLIDDGKVSVGITELLAQSLERLDLFRPVTFEISKPANASVFGFARASLADEEIEAFRARSYWDFQLYDHALKHFQSG